MAASVWADAMAPAPLPAIWPKWAPPDAVVAGVDGAAAVAVGGEARARLTEHVAPHDIVGRIDDAVAVVVARQEHTQNAAGVELRGVPHESGADRRQHQRH